MTRSTLLGTAILATVTLLGVPDTMSAQSISLDSTTAAAVAHFRPSRLSTALMPPLSVDDSTAHPRSRLGLAGLGFLAGAGAGVILAYFVNRGEGDGRLENYIGIPLLLGALTFATVFVATGD